MDFFYTQPKNITNDTLLIDEDEYNHLVHVMRKKEGDIIFVVDGKGTAYEVEISKLIKKTAECKIIKSFRNYNESEIKLYLGVGVLKNPSKFDFLVEKVTELGVHEIIPLTTERTIPHHAKIDRWQKLVLAAIKQCGRSYMPEVKELTTFRDIINSDFNFDLKIVLHRTLDSKPEENLHDVIRIKESKNILLLIGPEGGFSDAEIGKSKEAGFVIASMGSRRLRTETAAIAACSVLLTS